MKCIDTGHLVLIPDMKKPFWNVIMAQLLLQEFIEIEKLSIYTDCLCRHIIRRNVD